MLPSLQQLGIDQLSAEERLTLIGEIWETLPAISSTEIPLSHREELDVRIAEADADPVAATPWKEVLKELRSKP